MAERMAQEVPLIGNRGKVCTDPIMLMCAFRYALGRGTYIVGWVADELIEHRLALRSQWRQQIVRDIREAIGEDDAGWGIDATQWRQVVEAFFAVPAACRGCALTVDVCRTWRPLCCDACDHTPGSDADGSEPDLEVWVPPAEDCMQSDHEPCPHCASDTENRAARGLGPALSTPERYPARDFASPRVRNQHMVDLGADVCLAFAERWASGTGMCARMARAAGIHTIDLGVSTASRRPDGTTPTAAAAEVPGA